MKYKPKPIDTSGVKLPRGLQKLTEELAENNHDLWAKKRLAEGWTYGPNRDDRKKTHPDLIPYNDLSDSEKEYDRITAMEGLRAIIALGYQIEPPSAKPPPNKDYPHWAIKEMVHRLKNSEPLDVQSLLEIGSLLEAEYYAGSPKVYALLGNRILKAGEPLLAYDVISTGLGHWPKNVRLRQLQGLALARKTNWKKKGLPEGLDLRISLHAGPLYRCKDPVIKKYKYTGSHVSRAARIEPITRSMQARRSRLWLLHRKQKDSPSTMWAGCLYRKKAGLCPCTWSGGRSCSRTGGAT